MKPALAAAVGFVLLTAIPVHARSVKLKMAGSQQDALKLIEQLNKHGKDKGLDFVMTSGDEYQFRVAIYSEGASTSDVLFGTGGADSSAAVLTPQCELLFVVTRSGRMTSGGASNAVAKELIKKFDSYFRVTSP